MYGTIVELDTLSDTDRNGTSAEEFFLKSINVESIFEFVERTDYLFLYSIKECVEKSDWKLEYPTDERFL